MMQPGDDKIVADRIHARAFRRSAAPNLRTRRPRPTISADAGMSTSSSSAARASTRCISRRMATGFKARTKEIFRCETSFGTIEGDQMKLRSQCRTRPGDSVSFIFAGTLSGDTISGPIYMGEYLNAKFTAKRTIIRRRAGPIVVPSGPPLAN